MTIVRTSSTEGIVRITYQRAGKTVVETWQASNLSPSAWGNTQPCPPRDATSLDRPSFDFGEVPVGAEQRFVFTYRNDGEGFTGSPSVMVDGPDFAISPAAYCPALPKQGSCQISVRFRPLGPGNRVGFLQVTANPGGTVMASLTGVGVVPDAGPQAPADAGADMEAQPDAPDGGAD